MKAKYKVVKRWRNQSERTIARQQAAIAILEAALTRTRLVARVWRDRWVEAQTELGR